MKVAQSLSLQSSLIVTSEMRLAIPIMAMDSQEIDHLIDEDLFKNPCLIENNYDNFNYNKNFHVLDTALNMARRGDFREYLFDQVRISKFNIIEKTIAENIIYNVDDDGLLLD